VYSIKSITDVSRRVWFIFWHPRTLAHHHFFVPCPKTIPLFSSSFVAVILKLKVTHSGSSWCSLRKQLLSSIYFRPDHHIYFLSWWFVFISFHVSGRCGRDRMLIGVITTYVISAYHHWNLEFESRSDEVIQFVSDLQQVGGILRVLRVSTRPQRHDTWKEMNTNHHERK
jgi:hypothetical protein